MQVHIHERFFKGHPNDFEKHCRLQYGDEMQKKISRRIENARATLHFLDLKKMPGRWHWLTGDRDGQISADLVHPQRLIFLPRENREVYFFEGIFDERKIKELILIDVVDTHQ